MKVPKGFLVSGIHCGIKRSKLDLGLIYGEEPLKVKGVFTTNSNPSYSVTLSKKNINKSIKAIIVNSGNANCHSHGQGLKDTEKIIEALAKELNVAKSSILIASTGIIGEKLPKEKIIAGFPKLIKNLGKKSNAFADSILTTDAFKKTSSVSLSKAFIAGFAKGAGMIYPNMATMLGFILTDVDISAGSYNKIFKEAVEKSFNSISIDGCMSTNDCVFLTSSKKVKLKTSAQINSFKKGLEKVCLDLAKQMVKDGEGASKFIEIEIKGARTESQAKKGGLAMANSNLFKCAIYGADANWGRIIAALGQVNIKVKENISIKASNLKQKNVKISIDLKDGNKSWTVYASDLTPEYVKLNGKYS